MRFNIITIFPEYIKFIGLIGKALEKNIWKLNTIDLKNYKEGKMIDDRPFSGGPGMIIKPTVVSKAIEENNLKNSKLIFTSPKGRVFDQKYAKELLKYDDITILCGRYEGVDQRVIDYYNFEEVSIGDFVLPGGETPAMVMIETIVRLLPNVLHNEDSLTVESNIDEAEYPQYTRPIEWNNMKIPDVLVSGHHANIEAWKKANTKKKGC